jgi:hypothetical protein
MKRRLIILTPLLAALSLSVGAPARADSAAQGRVSALEGDLLVKGPEDVEWSYLERNGVVYDGDVVWADADSLAELEMEGGAWVRLGPDTRLDLRRLPPAGDLLLTRGSISVDLTRRSAESVLVRTPPADLVVRAGSLARIDLAENDRVRVAVSRGAVEARPDWAAARLVSAGQLLDITPSGRRLAVLSFGRGDWDDFDNWCDERLVYFRERSLPVAVTQYLPGVLELADYGDWIDYEGARCWRPRRIADDWRPYSNGYWGWGRSVPVWMPYEPWGYTTCHYGRWRWANNFGWCWSPTYTWGPAWVQWASFGNYCAWGPLGPFGRVAYRNRPWNVGNLAVDSMAWSFMPRQNFFQRDPSLVHALDRAPRLVRDFRIAGLQPVGDFRAIGRDFQREAHFRGRRVTATAAGPAPDRLRLLEQRPRRADVRIPDGSVREARRRGERARSQFTERVLGAREGPDHAVDRTPGRLPVPGREVDRAPGRLPVSGREVDRMPGRLPVPDLARDRVPASERDRDRTPGDRRGRLPRPGLGEQDGDRGRLPGPGTPGTPRVTVPVSPRAAGERAPRDRGDWNDRSSRTDRSIRNDRDDRDGRERNARPVPPVFRPAIERDRELDRAPSSGRPADFGGTLPVQPRLRREGEAEGERGQGRRIERPRLPSDRGAREGGLERNRDQDGGRNAARTLTRPGEGLGTPGIQPRPRREVEGVGERNPLRSIGRPEPAEPRSSPRVPRDPDAGRGRSLERSASPPASFSGPAGSRSERPEDRTSGRGDRGRRVREE